MIFRVWLFWICYTHCTLRQRLGWYLVVIIVHNYIFQKRFGNMFSFYCRPIASLTSLKQPKTLWKGSVEKCTIYLAITPKKSRKKMLKYCEKMVSQVIYLNFTSHSRPHISCSNPTAVVQSVQPNKMKFFDREHVVRKRS